MKYKPLILIFVFLVLVNVVYAGNLTGGGLTFLEDFLNMSNMNLTQQDNLAHLDMSGALCRGTGTGGCIQQEFQYIEKTDEHVGSFGEFTGIGGGTFSSIPPNLHNSMPLLFRNASFNLTDDAGEGKKRTVTVAYWSTWLYDNSVASTKASAVTSNDWGVRNTGTAYDFGSNTAADNVTRIIPSWIQIVLYTVGGTLKVSAWNSVRGFDGGTAAGSVGAIGYMTSGTHGIFSMGLGFDGVYNATPSSFQWIVQNLTKRVDRLNLSFYSNATVHGVQIYASMDNGSTWTNLTNATATTVTPVSSHLILKANFTANNSVLYYINVTGFEEVADTTPPVVNITNFNSSDTIRFGNRINISAFISGTATTANITFNTTGNFDFYNFTSALTGATQFISQNITGNITRGNVLNASVVACDSANNCAINSTLITIADTLGSIFIGLNITSGTINSVVNVSGNATDIDLDFSQGVISYNISGNPQLNFSFDIAGTKGNFSRVATINLTRGNVINFTVFYNDTSGTKTQNSTLFTVTNTVPNATNFVNATGKHYTKNISINWTPSDNPDLDVINYVVFWDLDITPTAVYYNGTDLNLTTNWTSDNTYFYQIKAMDSSSESALSSVFNSTLDTGLPALTINISNNTFSRVNNTFRFTLEDTFPYNLTIRVYMGSNNYYVNYSNASFGRFINITILLNLTDDGNYTIEINGSDSDKTSPRIKDKLAKQKQSEETHIYTDAKRKIQMDLNLEFENSTGNALPLPSNLKTFSEFNSKGTHLEFGLNFTVDKFGTVPVLNIKTVNVTLVYLNSTGLNNFMWHPYGIDFEGELRINKQIKKYGVRVKKTGQQNNFQVILIPNQTLNAGDNLTFISSSVYGLNVIDITNTYVYDTKVPTFVNAFNRSLIANTTDIRTNTDVNTTIFGLDDLYLKEGNFSENCTLTSREWLNHSMSIIGNTTPYFNVLQSTNFTEGQVCGWKFYVYDLAGNVLDPIYTFRIGGVATTPSASSPDTSGGGGGGGGGATRQCKEYAVIYKTCYYFDGISSCLKGCPKGQICNNSYECTSTLAVKVPLLTSLTPEPLRSPLQRLLDWVKVLLKPSLESIPINPSLSIMPVAEQTPMQKTQQGITQVRDNIQQALKTNPQLPYIITGALVLFVALWYFGILAMLWGYLMGMGIWGYIILLVAIIILFNLIRWF